MIAAKHGKRRIPFFIWGDMQQHGAPIVRDVQAGWRAIECMYAWIYSTEMLALRRMRSILDANAAKRPDTSIFELLNGELWQHFSRSKIDPHFQLSKDIFGYLVYILALLESSRERKCTIVEFGSTFMSAIDKAEIVSMEAKRRVDQWGDPDIDWVGIEISNYAIEMADIFHPNQIKSILPDPKRFEKENFSVLYSRFVCSYAFLSTADFVNFVVQKFDGVLIEDAFSGVGHELEVFNHGQRETFFDLDFFVTQLEANGFDVFILGSYPDNPAYTSRCHVVKIFCARSDSAMGRVRETVTSLGYEFEPELQRVRGGDLLKNLNSSVSEEHWRAVANAKRKRPIWGPTPKREQKALKAQILDWLYKRKLDVEFYRSGWRVGRIPNEILRVKTKEAVADFQDRLT